MPEPSTHFARQQEYVFDYDHRASEKHLGGLESIDCGWALVTFCHQFWESIDDSVEGTKCRALRAFDIESCALRIRLLLQGCYVEGNTP